MKHTRYIIKDEFEFPLYWIGDDPMPRQADKGDYASAQHFVTHEAAKRKLEKLRIDGHCSIEAVSV